MVRHGRLAFLTRFTLQKILSAVASEFCPNHRTFDRFSSRATSLKRLGYESRDINRLLADTKAEWYRDNIPTGFREQVYPYPCEDPECGRCQEAYESRRVSRFRRTVQAFADLYFPRGRLEFQTLTVPPYAPKPQHVHDVLHDTEPTQQVYQGWLDGYLKDRVDKARESLKACIARWRDVGRRRCTNPEEHPMLREYEDVPIRFARSALRHLPRELLSQSEIQRVYGIITNQLKSEIKDEVAMDRGYADVHELFEAVSDDVVAQDRLRELLSAIALERLRELKKTGEFSERVKAWFSRADVLTQAKLQSDIGLTGGHISELLSSEIREAWLLACWHEGWLQACVESARVYIPLQAERTVTRDGNYCIRQEYGPDPEPYLKPRVAGVVSLPDDCPVYRMPRAVVTDMLKRYRNRLRRAGIRFRYISVSESGTSEEHIHVHAVMGFDVNPDGKSGTATMQGYRVKMRRAWHAVSGNIIWRRGRWSERVREVEKIGNYMGKYLTKDAGRQTWVSHNLGLQRYNRERRLVDLGLLPARDAPIAELPKGGYCFMPAFSDAEVDAAGASVWVGLTRIDSVRLRDAVIPKHVRVDAVAFSTKSPSLGAAAGVQVVHRSRGAVDVIPKCDVWLPAAVFFSLCREGIKSPVAAASRLVLELQVAMGKVGRNRKESREFAENRHNPVYRAAYEEQQLFAIKAFEALQADYEELTDMLVSAVHESTGIWLRAP